METEPPETTDPEEEEIRQKLQIGVDFGNITEFERDEFLRVYHEERFRQPD